MRMGTYGDDFGAWDYQTPGPSLAELREREKARMGRMRPLLKRKFELQPRFARRELSPAEEEEFNRLCSEILEIDGGEDD